MPYDYLKTMLKMDSLSFHYSTTCHVIIQTKKRVQLNHFFGRKFAMQRVVTEYDDDKLNFITMIISTKICSKRYDFDKFKNDVPISCFLTIQILIFIPGISDITSLIQPLLNLRYYGQAIPQASTDYNLVKYNLTIYQEFEVEIQAESQAEN